MNSLPSKPNGEVMTLDELQGQFCLVSEYLEKVSADPKNAVKVMILLLWVSALLESINQMMRSLPEDQLLRIAESPIPSIIESDKDEIEKLSLSMNLLFEMLDS